MRHDPAQGERPLPSWIKQRRTHSVHRSHEEAVRAAYQLGHLLNGVPTGYVFAVQPKMGVYALVSLPTECYR